MNNDLINFEKILSIVNGYVQDYNQVPKGDHRIPPYELYFWTHIADRQQNSNVLVQLFGTEKYVLATKLLWSGTLM